MFFSFSSLDDVVCSLLPSYTKIKDRVERSDNEVDLVVESESEIKKLKIFNVSEVKEKRVLKFVETQSLLSECNLPFIYPSKIHQMNSNVMIYERSYYQCDLKSIIYTKYLSLSEISSIMVRLSDILMKLCECDIYVSNVKSSNIIYENNEMKLVDLCLNELRSSEDMRIDEICYRSPEELSGGESNEKSVIWSIGCILYEMLNKDLPFKEDNDVFKTLNNIMRCKLNDDDLKGDDEMMKEILLRMLKVVNEDRLSLMEFNKEMIKENEILKDSENNIMIIEERKEILYNNDNGLRVSFHPPEYYYNNEKWEEIRDNLIKFYNNEANERILSILLMMKLYKEDKSIKDRLKFRKYISERETPIKEKVKFRIRHKCKVDDSIIDYMKFQKEDKSIKDKLKFQIQHLCKGRKECYLDKMMFNVDTDWKDKRIIKIYSYCFCFCEEGMNYFFKILQLINPTKLNFHYKEYKLYIPIQSQPLFGLCFSQLSNLQELDLSHCNLTFHFIESFVKSIPSMKKLKFVDIYANPIGPTGFKLLLPYLHLLINKDNGLNLYGMNLNDESMILLLSELYKYPNLKKINIRKNNRIHSIGLKSLFSKFPISKIEFDFNGSKELLIDKDIPELVKYMNELDLNNTEIGDILFKSFISFRLNELREIERLDLSNIQLTSESVEILINNLSSLPNLKYLRLYGNPIGDVGMKMLSPHLRLLKKYNNEIYCSKMGLSSEGLKYLLDGLKNIDEKIYLYISDNHIDSCGIEYLMNYMKENDNIEKFFIHNNPIGNDGFKLLLNNLNMLIDYCHEMNLSNISIDDESMILLTSKLNSIEKCKTINLCGNNIKMNGLKSICEKTLENEKYPFIEMKSSNWRKLELEYYMNYCIEKKRDCYDRKYDFSSIKNLIFIMKIEMNLNDSHISLIKQIDYVELNLSNNKISIKGVKELTDSLPLFPFICVSIFGNEIGDEGVEIICEYLDKFVEKDWINPISLNLSNIGMSERGLKMLIERLKDYKPLRKIDISGNVLNEEELRLIKENKEVFDCLEELSITIKENINKNELKSFLETFSSIGIIKLNGTNEEEKKELSKHFFNIK